MRLRLAQAAVLGLVLTSPLVGQQPVLVAESSVHGLSAYLEGGELSVRGWPAAVGRLVLGRGSFPRFDAQGNLFFERSTDDGHQVLSQSHWWVPTGTVVAQPVREGRWIPEYRLPVTAAGAAAAVKVCVDAGHGGSDPGAVGIAGLQEAMVTLDVTLRLRKWLDLDTQDPRGGGAWVVQMTRTSNSTVSLMQRTNIANAFGAASFLSVHMNSFSSSSANGTETYCYLGQEQNAGGRLRNQVQKEALVAWGLRNRGTKAANFYVLRRTSMPASLLEGGFITSPVDVVKLRDPVARDNLALHCLYALQQHHGFGRYRPGAVAQTGKLRGVLYDASQGTVSRVSGGTVALSDGTFVVSRAGDGYFEFTLPAGSYSFAGTAAGFDAVASSRVVVAGSDVWGSLGLPPANVPRLGMTANPAPGGSLGITVQGDPGSPVVLVVGVAPGLPLLDLSVFGLNFGILWPSLAGSASLGIGSVSGGGVLVSRLRAPSSVGARAHCQAVLLRGGSYRLTNGAAFEVR